MAGKKLDTRKRNQMVILIILTAVLLIVIFWQYLLSPLLTRCDELVTQIEDHESAILDMKLSIASIEPVKRSTEEYLAKLEECTEQLYPMMNTDDADIILLNTIEKSGMTAYSLSITDEEENESSSGVKYIIADYSAKGSYAQLVKLIALINENPSVIITSVSGTAVGSEEEIEIISPDGVTNETAMQEADVDEMEFEISFTLYMYDPPVIPDTFAAENSTDEAYEETSEGILDFADDYL